MVPYSGIFSRVQIFAIWLQSPPAEIFAHVSNVKKPHPPINRLAPRIHQARVLLKMAESTYSTETVIRGYHVYKNIWTAVLGEELF